jgi:rubrerythrin
MDKLLRSREVKSSGATSKSCAPVSRADHEQTASQDAPQSAPPPAVTKASAKQAVQDMEDMDVDVAEEEVAAQVSSPFDGVDPRVLARLQDFLDAEGLNSSDGVAHLAALDPNSPEFERLKAMLVKEVGMTPEEALEQLLSWQEAHKDVQKELEKVKMAGQVQQPIWRCRVCGRADKPWIACWVAPYIVGYQAVNRNGP